ncbi:hypothetical protein G7K_2568-t1 [Saitoella complicata NRRL Y-17804]|uniref:Uncharacterized protein n=1 Tax=Saitoella complicata (strain BCRC 22490 / CBS 7301 / JCM 7358 / NBRC 10748 / NRRL Y-17804) TaxID=698492 RepID=A0A0E9NG78_SAICN|nr:hypothetical protein G7K_2568-t1 [Saitoella complicata NRRL Y-17804]
MIPIHMVNDSVKDREHDKQQQTHKKHTKNQAKTQEEGHPWPNHCHTGNAPKPSRTNNRQKHKTPNNTTRNAPIARNQQVYIQKRKNASNNPLGLSPQEHV